MTNPAGFSLRHSKMTANSENGWRLNGVKKFTTNISTNQEWKTIGIDNIPARLSPFKAQTIYIGGNTRNLKINGAINYDGAIPGAVVTALKTGGDLTMMMTDDERVMRFIPKDNAPFTITRIETDTEWRAEDISGQLLTQEPLYRRKGNESDVSTTLSDVKFILIDQPNERNLGLNFNTMDVSGNLIENKQNWVINAQDTKICSEDTPGPGTDIRMPNMALELWRAPDQDMRFKMSAPIAHVKTQLVTANDLAIEAQGTPNNYIMNYSPGTLNKGRVKFTGDALPHLPMTGVVNYACLLYTSDAADE